MQISIKYLVAKEHMGSVVVNLSHMTFLVARRIVVAIGPSISGESSALGPGFWGSADKILWFQRLAGMDLRLFVRVAATFGMNVTLQDIYREFSWIVYTCHVMSNDVWGFLLCHVVFCAMWVAFDQTEWVLHSKSRRNWLSCHERHQAKSSGYELGNCCHFGVFLYISLYPCDNRWAVLFKGAWPASRDGMLWLPWLQSYAVANSSCTASADPLQNFSNYPKSWWVSFVWLGTCPDYWHLILGCFNLDAPAGSQCLLLARWRPIRPLPR